MSVKPSSQPEAELTTESLTARACAGDRGAFDVLVVRYRPRLVAFLRRRLADTAEAEDVAQDTFLRAYDQLARYDPARPFATWLFAIGKNLAINHAVARARRTSRDQASPEAAIAHAAETDLWHRAASVLSTDAYRALWLRYVQGLTVREIAAELGRSSVAIKVMLFRARRRMLQEVR